MQKVIYAHILEQSPILSSIEINGCNFCEYKNINVLNEVPPPLFQGPMLRTADDVMDQILNCFDISYGTASCNDAIDLVAGLVVESVMENTTDLDAETSTNYTKMFPQILLYQRYKIVVFISQDW